MNKNIKPLLDWNTFRFAYCHDPDAIIIEKLKMDPQLFEAREHSPLPNYRKSKFFGGIFVCFDGYGARGIAAAGLDGEGMDSSSDRMGVCVSMPGEGCRTFENMSTLRFEKGGAMEQLLQTIYLDPDASMTRVDLALDDHSGVLDIDKIIDYAISRRLDSRLVSLDVHLSQTVSGQPLGKTLYIGSEKSSFRIRIYDKAKQMYTPDQPEFNKPWIRVEIVMRGKYANGFVNAYCNSDDLGSLASGILNNHLRFIERDDSNITRCSTAQWWADFVASVEEVKLFVPEPIQHTIDRMAEWLTYQIAPSLATYYKAYGWEGMKRLLATGKGNMSAKHNAVLKDFEQRKMSHKLSCPGAPAASTVV